MVSLLIRKLSGQDENLLADDDDYAEEMARRCSIPLLGQKRNSIDENEKSSNYLPDWLSDEDLKNGETDTLTTSEEKFWTDLIEKYLKPLELSEADKAEMKSKLIVLRDICIFAFVMLNALFVLIVFLLQLNKSYLHIQWPFNAKYFIEYDASTREILIKVEYLELEPIGLMFVLFFGVILFVQFLAMLVHRFGTISQILATTPVDWYIGKSSKEMTEHAEINGSAVDIARTLQRPKPQWDENDITIDKNLIGRRQTIHRILYQHKNKKDYSNLEQNFKKAWNNESDLDMRRLTLSRKSQTVLETRRKSMIDQRKMRKSNAEQLNGFRMTGNNNFMDNTKQDVSPPAWKRNIDRRISGPMFHSNSSQGFINQAFDAADDMDEDYDQRPRPSRVTFA